MQSTDLVEAITDSFHKLYYNNSERTWQNTYWLGTPVLKCPLDLWVYQEIIYETKPDIIIECGTYAGGSALYMASVCDLINKGKIITIDIEPRKDRPFHKRLTYLTGSSVALETIHQLRELLPEEGSIMVVLDSDHSKSHVLEELKMYSSLVTKSCYLIVEDTNLNGHPVCPFEGGAAGPMEALEEFLTDNNEFIVDTGRQKLYLTFNPKGYLKRV